MNGAAAAEIVANEGALVARLSSSNRCHHNCEKYLKDAVAFIDREGRVILNTSFCAAGDLLRGAPSSSSSSEGVGVIELPPQQQDPVHHKNHRYGGDDADLLAKRLERERIVYAERNRRGQHHHPHHHQHHPPRRLESADMDTDEFRGILSRQNSADPSSSAGGGGTEESGSVSDEYSVSLARSLRRMIDEEAKQPPFGNRIQLVDHVISAVSEAHLSTCNYTSEKVAKGLSRYHEMMKDKPKVGR